ncbi:MinD/ParA family ATP-binding protein [Nonomuraea polychroma]|uniref:MinD/ParA family ATP-binding protein n=1 Tax=Nonomuraea polychroma TaxID=46176 RepID=UPI001F4F066E|nr:MinD/ParA family protein [Nonomuraea polychroma]
MDPDLTRTIRFPPPNRSTGAPAVDKPPPPPPVGLWRQQDRAGSEPPAPAPAQGHFDRWNAPGPAAWPSPGGPPPGAGDSPENEQAGWRGGEPGPGVPGASAPGIGEAGVPQPAEAAPRIPESGVPKPGEAAPPRRVFPPPGQPPHVSLLPQPEQPSWEPVASPPLPQPEQPSWEPAAQEQPSWEPAAQEQQPSWEPAAPVQQQPAGAAPDPDPAGPAMSSESLRPERLLRTRRRPPSGGWRKAVYTLSGGLIRPQDSKAERRRHELIERIRRPVASGHFRIAVMSLKGGVGKTTTTIGLGSTLAHQRGDRVIAVDANPDRGTLSEKLRLESPATVRHLLNDRGGIWRYADVRSYTSQAPSRLEVLASDRDPAISEAFNADDYRAVAQILEQFYSISITDCGTGMLHSAMGAILDMADQIVLVSPVTVDGARSASATLDWLQAHGHQKLAKDAVVVLSAVKNTRRNPVNLEELKGHFAQRCRAVIGVPFDPHLEQGAEVDLDLLRTATRDTYLEVGATIADRFSQRAGA